MLLPFAARYLDDCVPVRGREGREYPAHAMPLRPAASYARLGWQDVRPRMIVPDARRPARARGAARDAAGE